VILSTATWLRCHLETDECSDYEKSTIFMNDFYHCNTSKLLLLNRKSEKIWIVYWIQCLFHMVLELTPYSYAFSAILVWLVAVPTCANTFHAVGRLPGSKITVVVHRTLLSKYWNKDLELILILHTRGDTKPLICVFLWRNYFSESCKAVLFANNHTIFVLVFQNCHKIKEERK